MWRVRFLTRRYADFKVNEVSLDGRVMRLTSLDPPPRVRSPPPPPAAASGAADGLSAAAA